MEKEEWDLKKQKKRNMRHYNTLINLTSECVIISEYNHLTDYHHYGNHGALPTCTCITLWAYIWVQFH